MYKIKQTALFNRDLKRIDKRNYKMDHLADVVNKLAAGEPLDRKYNDHPLKGKYKDCRECHIAPDWLLVYKLSKQTLILLLMRTGTHSDLFE